MRKVKLLLIFNNKYNILSNIFFIFFYFFISPLNNLILFLKKSKYFKYYNIIPNLFNNLYKYILFIFYKAIKHS